MTDVGKFANMESVTDLNRELAGADSAADAAVRSAEDAARLAEDAARLAGVRVRTITTLDDLNAVYRLYDGIWRPESNNPPISTELLRALTKAGSYVAGAFEGEELVGACVGFFGAPADGTIHSHIAGVSAAVRGRSVGFALKLHQRAWALLRGVTVIAWTYDPLVGRNAHFNLVKLAALPTEYLPNFYGGMHDVINGSDDTDRLLVHWDLQAPRVVAACAGSGLRADAAAEVAGGAVIALARSERGGAVVGTLDGPTLLVATPADIEQLRTTDPGLAKEWRVAVRDVLCGLMADGARVTGFDRAGWYIVSTKGDTA